MKYCICILVALISIPVASAKESARACSLDTQRVYSALKKAAAADQSKLWGKSIDGAFLLVNPSSREAEIVVNTEPELQCTSQLLAPDLPIANTCIELDGKRFALLRLPVPMDEKELVRLSTHERWHCIRESLGIAVRGDDNAHLDTVEGRILLRMEIRALRASLDERNQHWKRSAADAISYRAQRSRQKKLNSDVLQEEAKLEAKKGWQNILGSAFPK
jgi:hypothetical protein